MGDEPRTEGEGNLSHLDHSSQGTLGERTYEASSATVVARCFLLRIVGGGWAAVGIGRA